MDKVAHLINSLQRKNLSLALAESCSGGYASYLLTQTAGSSKVFKGAALVYSAKAKNKLLNIPVLPLRYRQGVSKEVAASLAIKVRKKLSADIGLSIVGFAGPSAPKGKKGTVFLGISDKVNTIAIQAVIKGERDAVRKKASFLLIELLALKFK